MKRMALLLAALLIFSACSRKTEETPATDWRTQPYERVEEAAKGTTVTIAMYGGWAHVNTWMDGWVATELQKRYGITLKRVPMDAAQFVTKIVGEKQADAKDGSIDLLWINGENFKNMRLADALAGPFADALPNVRLAADDTRAEDFGYPVNGFEAPWGRAFFVFEYDSAKGDYPKSFAELPAWVRKYPGQFTYPEPPDFTGSAFIRQAFCAVNNGCADMTTFDETAYQAASAKLWLYLNDIKPYLWHKGEDYPKDSAMLDTLFATGELKAGMSYHPVHAANKITEGSFPATTRTFVMAEGTLFNTHYLAIPWNTRNMPGAMVVANFLASADAQLEKNKPAVWGDFSVIDMTRLNDTMRGQFAALDFGAATLPLADLTAKPLKELPAEYLERLEKDWRAQVLKQ